jgi:hypothetical protein
MLFVRCVVALGIVKIVSAGVLGMFVDSLRGWLGKECINGRCWYTQVIAQQCELMNVRQPKPVGSKRKYYKAAKRKQKTDAD